MRKIWLPLLSVMVVTAVFYFYTTGGRFNDIEKKQIYVFLPSAQNPFWIDVRSGVDAQAQEHRDHLDIVVITSGDLDAASQVEQLKSILARGSADAVVIGLANNQAPAPVIAEYNNAGIPVVMIDTKLDKKAATQSGATWNAFIGSDNLYGGKLAAEVMIDGLRKRGSKEKKVLLIKGSYVHQSAIDRAEGFIEGATGELTVIEREGEWSNTRANELTTGVMLRSPVDGIFASNDDMAMGAIASIINLDLTAEQTPLVIGFDATPVGKEAVNSGSMYASIGQDANGMGAAGVSAALALARGEEVSTERYIPVKVYPESKTPK